MSDLAFTASCAECYRKNQRIAALEKLCQQQHEAMEKAEQENVALRAKVAKLEAPASAAFPQMRG